MLHRDRGRRRAAVVSERFLLLPQLRHFLLHLHNPLLSARDLKHGGVELGAQPHVLGLEPDRGLPVSLELVALGRQLGLQKGDNGNSLLEYLLLQQLDAEARLPLLELLDGAQQASDFWRRTRGLHLRRRRAREVGAQGASERRRLGRRRAGRPGRGRRRNPGWRLCMHLGGGRRRLGRTGTAVEAHGRLDTPGHHDARAD